MNYTNSPVAWRLLVQQRALWLHYKQLEALKGTFTLKLFLPRVIWDSEVTLFIKQIDVFKRRIDDVIRSLLLGFISLLID